MSMMSDKQVERRASRAQVWHVCILAVCLCGPASAQTLDQLRLFFTPQERSERRQSVADHSADPAALKRRLNGSEGGTKDSISVRNSRQNGVNESDPHRAADSTANTQGPVNRDDVSGEQSGVKFNALIQGSKAMTFIINDRPCRAVSFSQATAHPLYSSPIELDCPHLGSDRFQLFWFAQSQKLQMVQQGRDINLLSVGDHHRQR